MSTSPLVRDPDLGRLLDDGYSVVVQEGHLVITHIPYMTPDRGVRYGFLTYPVTVAGDRIVSGTDHRIWFGGDTPPCNEHGVPLTCANPEVHPVAEGLQANYMLSSKPPSGAYASEYEKVTAYARIVSHPAAAIDPTATATPGGAWQVVEDDLPFVYRDTASTRAGLTELNRVFRGQRIGIVGLGGTGGYILDQIAKTPVDTIACFDGDTFENHNAFRGPGAPSLELLRERPNKAEYFTRMYSKMHTGITAYPEFIEASNVNLLNDCTFVFLAIDDTTVKAPILAHFAEREIPSIDVGMGVEEIDGKISGLLRTTLNLPGTITDGIAMSSDDPDERRDDYSRNIQIADLNARNAIDAVSRWKRYLAFYADGSEETSSTYSIFTNRITNDGGARDGADDEG